MKKVVFALMFCLFILGCTNIKKRQLARQMADKLLVEIGEGTAENEFPEQYFSPRAKSVIQTVLKDKCDFQHRQQRFINDWYETKAGGVDRVSFLYACYLKCDSMRIIVTYDLGEKIVLTDFKGQRLSESNPMVINK
jgi:hypothetical protein